ncbi:hypothetical protein CDAR_547221 [Caerostris darwini]|uniref:Uncharacterized protein n=1 Tax=Caerostris darwini TaxID=1538125 RepID=A0AAV4WUJ8_9ARAC|nr:hypothetical protein CDAR_547221 [Caerostris darwini]
MFKSRGHWTVLKAGGLTPNPIKPMLRVISKSDQRRTDRTTLVRQNAKKKKKFRFQLTAPSRADYVHSVILTQADGIDKSPATAVCASESSVDEKLTLGILNCNHRMLKRSFDL